MRYIVIIGIIFISTQICAQDLFEEAVSNRSDAKQEKSYELNGYMRGVFFGGKVPEKDEAEVKSSYGEFSLKLKVRKNSVGDGFAEIRFRRGNEFNENISEFNLREAYTNTYIGKFDFRFGYQIVVWGRADGFNPTNNITPQNMLVRSPDEDDRREGNFLFRSFYTSYPVRLEAIWVPSFAASVLPTKIISLPPGIELTEPDYPDMRLKSGAAALKLNLELPSFDGSISYFSGYNPLPGIYSRMQNQIAQFVPKAYKFHVVGADFSTTIGSFGMRGEFAYRKPHKDYKQSVYIPNPELQYIIGIDKEYGDFSLILQYVGRYVHDFSELAKQQAGENFLHYRVALLNRMVSSQIEEITHAVSFRPVWKLMYETLDIEILGLYNVTTEELFLKPKCSYDIADALTFTIGGMLYSGPDETLFGMVDSRLSALFTELKVSF